MRRQEAPLNTVVDGVVSLSLSPSISADVALSVSFCFCCCRCVEVVFVFEDRGFLLFFFSGLVLQPPALSSSVYLLFRRFFCLFDFFLVTGSSCVFGFICTEVYVIRD